MNKTEDIGALIFSALMEEVDLTPKPGLVDRHDSGAHTDMDHHSFELSAAAVTPYLQQMYSDGLVTDDPEELFRKIRKTGIEAEMAMYAATGGVNTHKGMIFLMGVAAAAAGWSFAHCEKPDPYIVMNTAGKMTAKTLSEELAVISEREPETHGEKLYSAYGFKGARQQPMEGFPILREAYPLMEERRRMMTADEADTDVLLFIISKLDDTTVLYRKDIDTLRKVKKRAAEILTAAQKEKKHLIEAWNRECIREHISPGGSADLLAVTILLYQLFHN